MAVIDSLKLDGGLIVYPKTLTSAIYNEAGTERLDNKLSSMQSYKITGDDGTFKSLLANANTAVETGLYSYNASTVGAPDSYGGILEVFKRTSSHIFQRATSTSVSDIKIRYSSDGGVNWSKWKKVSTINMNDTALDLNTVRNDGVYPCTSYSTTNAPFPDGVCQVIEATAYVSQSFYSKTGEFATRTMNKTNSTWTDWNVMSKVIEYGQNSNGKYIKLEDGTMIAFNRVVFGGHNITATWGSWYISSADLTLYYPTAFYDNPCVSVHMENGSGDIATWMNSTVSNSSFKGRFARGVSVSLTVTVGWTAIGRWK